MYIGSNSYAGNEKKLRRVGAGDRGEEQGAWSREQGAREKRKNKRRFLLSAGFAEAEPFVEEQGADHDQSSD